MRTVWKYPIALHDGVGVISTSPRIEMPQNAQILTLQVQEGTPVIWALVEPEKPLVTRRFVIVGTGGEAPEQWVDYIGTWQMQSKTEADVFTYVFHLFELLGEAN